MSAAGLIVSMSRSCCSDHCWRAKCAACGEWLTKHDFTEQDAREVALSSDHACLRSVGVETQQ